MEDLQELVEELKAETVTWIVCKRSLPVGVHKVIAEGLDSYKDAVQFCTTMKLKTHDVMDGDTRKVIYYDILPENLRAKDVYYNNPQITTIGNDKKKVAINYMGLE